MTDSQLIIFQMKRALSRTVDDLGQVKVASICETSQSAISRALNPNYNPKMGTLIKWLKLLGFTLEFQLNNHYHIKTNPMEKIL